MPTPAHLSANCLSAQKTIGSRTASSDYARNHFTHFQTSFDIISAIFKPVSAYLSHSILIATICGYVFCINKIH
jgi:hypothetical protein